MAGFKRALKFFFERELKHLEWAFSPLKTPCWSRLKRKVALGSPGDGVFDPEPLPPPRRRSWPLVGSFSVSALFHLLLFGILAVSWIPESEKGPEKDGEVVFRVGIRTPKKPEAPVEREQAAPSREVEPPGDPARSEVDSPPLPGPEGNSEEKDVVEMDPRRGLPVKESTSLTDIAPPPLPNFIGLGTSPPPLPGSGNGIVRGFSTRGDGKGEALRRYGGGGSTESAVGRGLRWLADHQDESGGWSTDGFQRHCRHFVPCPGKGLPEFQVGVTALATLAFLGAGHLPDASDSGFSDFRSRPAAAAGEGNPYGRNVRKALEYLLSQQDGRGAFGALGDNYLYNHALATLAMAEAYAMSGSSRYRSSLEGAVAFSVAAQQSGGGWDYTSKSSGRNDLSITGWQIMALRSAASAGIAVPEEVLTRIGRFLETAVTADGRGLYANLGSEAGRLGINMVAVGLLSKIYMNALPQDLRVKRAAERLLREPPDWETTGNWEKTFQSYYYWYTATLALFHLGGEQWKAWNFFLLRAVLPLQSKKPHELGSWPPEANWVGASGGRVYATAINVLTLETYYRYEPLFKARKS